MAEPSQWGQGGVRSLLLPHEDVAYFSGAMETPSMERMVCEGLGVTPEAPGAVSEHSKAFLQQPRENLTQLKVICAALLLLSATCLPPQTILTSMEDYSVWL